MKLSGILFGLFAALSFSFAEVNSTPLHCGGCDGDKKECDSKKDCEKKKDCDKEKECCGECQKEDKEA